MRILARKLLLLENDNTIVQFGKYAVVGFIATAADMSVFHIFANLAGIHHLVANGLSFIGGLTVNYVLSRRWVFQARTGFTPKEFLLFAIIGVIGLAMSEAILFSLIDLGTTSYLLNSRDDRYINLSSKVVAVGIVLFWNYIARKKVVFNK